jgi:general secretion pathway protein G
MIELMIAVTIIAILTATGVVIYRNYIIKARVTKAQIEIRQLRMAIDTFGTPPSTEEGLQKLVDEKIIKKSGLMDPWGHPYQYRSPGENDDVDIWSLGADGKEGGEGNNKDITSWELDK